MRRLSLSSLLILAACKDPGDDGFDSFSGTASATAPTVTTDASTAESSTGAETSTSAAEGESSTSGAVDSSSSSSAGEMPVCGNSMVELGEQCDDGNDSDLDECTIACTVPRCDDRLLDGAETDLDCGGVCQGCDLCLGCLVDDDCAPSFSCGDDGRCIVREVMSVNWNANCGGVAQGQVLEDLPLGVYQATALPSAGTLWLPPFDPPTTGYFYEIQCGGGVQITQIRTPPNMRYATVASAFAALQADTQQFDFLGGDLTCYRSDNTCADNSGAIEFEIEFLCDES